MVSAKKVLPGKDCFTILELVAECQRAKPLLLSSFRQTSKELGEIAGDVGSHFCLRDVSNFRKLCHDVGHVRRPRVGRVRVAAERRVVPVDTGRGRVLGEAPQSPALAAVLALVGLKLLVSDLYEVPIGVSLAVIAALLAGAIAGSILLPPRGGRSGRDPRNNRWLRRHRDGTLPR